MDDKDRYKNKYKEEDQDKDKDRERNQRHGNRHILFSISIQWKQDLDNATNPINSNCSWSGAVFGKLIFSLSRWLSAELDIS